MDRIIAHDPHEFKIKGGTSVNLCISRYLVSLFEDSIRTHLQVIWYLVCIFSSYEDKSAEDQSASFTEKKNLEYPIT